MYSRRGFIGAAAVLAGAGVVSGRSQAAGIPCQCTVVCSSSLLVTKMRTLSPSTASMVGPGDWPL